MVNLTPRTIAVLHATNGAVDWSDISEPDNDKHVQFVVDTLTATARRVGVLATHVAVTRRGHVLATYPL